MRNRKNLPVWLVLAFALLVILFLLFKSWQRSREIEGALHQNSTNTETKK